MTKDRRRMTVIRRRMTEDGRQRAHGAILPLCGRRLPSAVCLLLVCLFTFAGCGRKDAPFIPERKPFEVGAGKLTGSFKDKALFLEGMVQGTDESLSRITGCRVYYVWYSLDAPPCEGCPVEMANYRDVTGRVVKNHRFECMLPAFEQKGICFVLVRLFEKEGRLGPGSNRIKLISKG